MVTGPGTFRTGPPSAFSLFASAFASLAMDVTGLSVFTSELSSCCLPGEVASGISPFHRGTDGQSLHL